MTSAELPGRSHRGTLFVEEAEVIAVRHFPGEQFVLRLNAPDCAARATAGSFVHVRCDPSIPMRRPLSIMRAEPEAGWIEVLFKVVGDGLLSLGEREAGDSVSIIGPVGHGFRPSASRPNALLIGGGVGIPPMIFLAETLCKANGFAPLVLMGSELPFPFETVRSSLASAWLPPDIDRTMPLLERWGVPARLASRSSFAGCLNGYVTDLATRWLKQCAAQQLAGTEVFACGPIPMLEAVAALAARYDLPCQVSLEEYMACAVGGCAGCTVLVTEDDGPAMKRVCVDGPVFEASRVFGN